jgi:type VI secretion system secreted protein Hcp
MKRRILIGTVLVAVLAAAGTTYAFAAAGAGTAQTINACVNREGQMRLVAVAGACRGNETALSWNTVGPVGPQGQQGVQGVAGRDGQPGPQGPPGASAANPDAVTATLMVTGEKEGAFSQTPIPVTAISHEIVSPRDAASGLPTGKRQHKPITITKEWDASSPLLLNALVSNENLTSVLIGLLRNGQQVATIKLTNASVADYQQHGDTDTWSFTYQKIEWTWIDGGITAQDDWETTS